MFLPVTVAVEQFRLVAKDGATLGSGQRIDVSPARDIHPAPGGLLLAPEDLPAPGRLVQTYPLAGYAADVPAEYEYVYEQERVSKLQIGVEAGGAKLAITGTSSMRSAVTLTYTLAGGRDYRLCRLADADGLLWG
ncbi:hypothetical protein ACFWBN_32280 [Streptomyces sp. NPDC059989]|uniref:hypothetical protein n=1 Tax=Streptomyces sp. NPDC059989 TaxID=3347026 RepID=UPI0036CFB304